MPKTREVHMVVAMTFTTDDEGNVTEALGPYLTDGEELSQEAREGYYDPDSGEWESYGYGEDAIGLDQLREAEQRLQALLSTTNGGA